LASENLTGTAVLCKRIAADWEWAGRNKLLSRCQRL